MRGAILQKNGPVDTLALGELDASVERTYPLAEVRDALAALQSGAVQGKLAVHVSD